MVMVEKKLDDALKKGDCDLYEARLYLRTLDNPLPALVPDVDLRAACSQRTLELVRLAMEAWKMVEGVGKGEDGGEEA